MRASVRLQSQKSSFLMTIHRRPLGELRRENGAATELQESHETNLVQYRDLVVSEGQEINFPPVYEATTPLGTLVVCVTTKTWNGVNGNDHIGCAINEVKVNEFTDLVRDSTGDFMVRSFGRQEEHTVWARGVYLKEGDLLRYWFNEYKTKKDQEAHFVFRGRHLCEISKEAYQELLLTKKS